MPFTLQIPNQSTEAVTIELEPGTSTFFVGANGSGKSRLAASAEAQWGETAHRISAHRSLILNPTVAKINEEAARAGLRFGTPEARSGHGATHRQGSRWRSKAETWLLNDFDFLVQTLFAEQSNVALQTHNAVHAGTIGSPGLTHFQRMLGIWDRILPHRALQVTGDDIKVVADGQQPYSAADMSDGERSVFYMLGQVLVAEPNSVLIFDEPELHVHRAILSRLWDEVEAARPDCAFLVITHDLEFAASRPGSKIVIRSYQTPGFWEVEHVTDDTGFGEEIATLILGSRKPILFVEGTSDSLDLAIYRACYPDWTVLPRGSCENVIHAVATMRSNASLTRITCSGIVDADDFSEEDKKRLADLGVKVLPVSEIDNLFLLPTVAVAILKEEKFEGAEVTARLDSLAAAVLEEVSRPGSIEEAVLRYCRRRIDRALKRIDLKDNASTEQLTKNYRDRTASLDVVAIAADFRKRINNAVSKPDLPDLLAAFDNKALLALAAKHLKSAKTKESFVGWLVRAMREPRANELQTALRGVLPEIEAA